jgi:hypothetical protein
MRNVKMTMITASKMTKFPSKSSGTKLVKRRHVKVNNV